tara:strand:+ start:3607 stop:3846 length:240 start_codon:yes stop_codon:yes gene_type:complete
MSRNAKKFKYKGKPSEVRESIEFEGYTIKVLKHGNTGHVLYSYPRPEDFERCWGMDLDHAKKAVLHWKENKDTIVESST